MTARVCLVTVAIDTAFLRWGLHLQQVVPPMVVYCAPAVLDALRDVRLPPNVVLQEVSSADTLDDPIPLRQRLDWMARARAGHVVTADVWCWIDLPLCYRHLSLHYLYSDLLTQTLASIEEVTTFRAPGYLPWSLFAGPWASLAPLLQAPEAQVADRFHRASVTPAERGAIRQWRAFHPVDEPNLYFSEPRSTPACHVIGDSHVFFCLTRHEEVAARANILAVAPRRPAGNHVPPLLFSHHAGSVTMHRAGRPGMLRTWAQDYRVRDGDTVVWCVGEVDVRCHIMRQHEYVGREITEVVETLADNFVSAMCDLQRDHGRLRQVVFAPIPPLDNPHYRSEAFPVHGSIEERVACRTLLVSRLAAACDRHGMLLLDVGPRFATPRGDLDPSESDHFCHLRHGHQGWILDQLFDLLDRAGPFPGAGPVSYP